MILRLKVSFATLQLDHLYNIVSPMVHSTHVKDVQLKEKLIIKKGFTLTWIAH